MSTIRDLFNILRNTETAPAHISLSAFVINAGYETKIYPVMTAPAGHTAEMSTTIDQDKGILRTDIKISMLTAGGGVYPLETHFLAERSTKYPEYFEIKAMMIDNRPLDICNGGHVELCLRHIDNYQRHLSGFGKANNWGFPVPRGLEDNGQLDRDIKHAGNRIVNKFHQIERYLAQKAQNKFWFGK
jgi:hypothetical protein